MKIVIPGGSGHLGGILARHFHDRGDEVVVLSRTPADAPWKTVQWDGESPGDWTSEIDGADAVINLAGRSVNCRYNAANRAEILNSRVNSTRVVGRAIADSKNPPRVWLQACTATIYTHRYDAANDETTGQLDEPSSSNAPDTWKFSVEVANAWEAAANELELPSTRRVLMRISIVMSDDPAGAFAVMLGLVRKGLGGKVGDGRQYISWIHGRDFAEAVARLIQDDNISGPVNLASPNPLPNAEFMRTVRQAWGTRIGLPAPGWVLEIGTFFMRTESELVLKSRRVMPGKLLESGFTFEFPTWDEAAADLCERVRERA